jgi:hypothetical protein
MVGYEWNTSKALFLAMLFVNKGLVRQNVAGEGILAILY